MNPAKISELQIRLERDGFKKKNGVFRGNCPWRAGSNSDGFAVRLDNNNGGIAGWFDHVNEDNGKLSDLAKHYGIANFEEHRQKTTSHRAEYIYRDEAGEPVYKVIRGKDKQFRQMHYCISKKWVWGLGGNPDRCNCPKIAPLPFCLPELANTAAEEIVIICEGEKDVLTAQKMGFVATCNSGGAGKWHNVDNPYFINRHVIIIADNDVPGEKHAADVAQSLQSVAASVKIIKFDGCTGYDLTDWVNDGGDCTDLITVIDDTPIWQPNTANKEKLPSIQTNARHHKEISNDAYQALVKANDPPTVFIRSGSLTRIVLDENGRPATEVMNSESLKYYLDRVANFYTLRQKQDGDVTETDSSIPMAVVKDIESYPQWVELPPLSNIVTYPTFLADGTLHDQAGYNPKTRLFYYKNNLKLGDYEPTGHNVASAKRLINELLQDFPFVDNASKTNTIALLLLPFVRPLIDGNTPMHLFDAPSHGTGKSLLAKAIMSVATPNGGKTMTAPTTEEEWEKKIVTSLIAAPSHILIDNIPDTLQTATLAAVLTTDYYTSRVLGLLKEITVQVKNIWIGTGNNTTAQGELARRMVWIRLDAKIEKPWERERSNFKHPDLLEWINQKRNELITAALTLIHLWFLADCPESDITLGSFEQWVKIMGGILETAGYEDFLGNANEMYDRSTVDRQPWLYFVDQWYEAYGFERVGTKQLFTIASETDPKPATANEPADPPMGDNLLGEFVTGHTERSRRSKFGKLLKQNIFKVFGKYRIVEAGNKQRLAQYKLETLNDVF